MSTIWRGWARITVMSAVEIIVLTSLGGPAAFSRPAIGKGGARFRLAMSGGDPGGHRPARARSTRPSRRQGPLTLVCTEPGCGALRCVPDEAPEALPRGREPRLFLQVPSLSVVATPAARRLRLSRAGGASHVRALQRRPDP